jgi:transcriptional regulator with GAF, ATPase, and Fis domain
MDVRYRHKVGSRKQGDLMKEECIRLERNKSLQFIMVDGLEPGGFIDKIKSYIEGGLSFILVGETGVGKDQIARQAQKISSQHECPFIAISVLDLDNDSLMQSDLFGHEKGGFTDASDKKKGSFHLADGGVLFLNEIGEMSMEVQKKLLGVFDSSGDNVFRFKPIGSEHHIEIKATLVGATNILDLEERVERGDLRKDLFYRLFQYKVRIPSLRERPNDLRQFILKNACFLLKDINPEVEYITTEAIEFLMMYAWVGNFRDVKKVIRCTGIDMKGKSKNSGTIELMDLKGERNGIFYNLCSKKERNPISRINLIEKRFMSFFDEFSGQDMDMMYFYLSTLHPLRDEIKPILDRGKYKMSKHKHYNMKKDIDEDTFLKKIRDIQSNIFKQSIGGVLDEKSSEPKDEENL